MEHHEVHPSRGVIRGTSGNPKHPSLEDLIGYIPLKLTDNHGAESLCSVDVEIDITL